jgi:hypothetical protein
LSPSANRQIADFERAPGLHPGSVASAFRRWAKAGRCPRQDPAADHGHDDSDLRRGYFHVRTLLERAARALCPRACRELRRQLQSLDDRVIARTVNDPFAPRDLPWWKSRIEI